MIQIKKILPVIIIISVLALCVIPCYAHGAIASDEEDNYLKTAFADVTINFYYYNGDGELVRYSGSPALELIPSPSTGDYSSDTLTLSSTSTSADGLKTSVGYSPSSYFFNGSAPSDNDTISFDINYPSYIMSFGYASGFYDNLALPVLYHNLPILTNPLSTSVRATYFNNAGIVLGNYTIDEVSSSFSPYGLIYDNAPTGTDYAIVDAFTIYGTFDAYYGSQPFRLTIPYWYSDAPFEPFSAFSLIDGVNDVIISQTIDSMDIGGFLWDSVSGFLNFEIADGVSLYVILITIVAVPILIWILKLFAGG